MAPPSPPVAKYTLISISIFYSAYVQYLVAMSKTATYLAKDQSESENDLKSPRYAGK